MDSSAPPPVPPRKYSKPLGNIQLSSSLPSFQESSTDSQDKKQIFIPSITCTQPFKKESSTSPKSPRSPRVASAPQESFKFISPTPGNLITSGNVIAAHLKKFQNESITSDKKETDEEFFARISQREMTDKDKDHYQRVINEYNQTEKAHIRGLEIMKEVYLIPISKCVSKSDEIFIRDVLTQVDIIIQVHQNFLEMFQKGLKETKPGELPMLGKEFVNNLQFLKMASQYIGNYDNYMKKLTEITQKDSSIEKSVKKAKEKFVNEHKDENITIGSIQPLTFYLITPIQRIPRYELLIRDMLKDVGRDFPDLEQLKKAYLQAKESGKGVNQVKMQLEENEKYTMVRDIIKGELKIKDEVFRKFICCGPMYFIENVNTPPSKLVYVFLFNDVLLETKPLKIAGKSVNIEDGESLKKAFNNLKEIKNIKDLETYEFELIRELPFTLGSCTFKPINDTSEVKNLFSILLREYKVIRNVEKDFPTLAKYSTFTQEEKEAWKSIIYDQFRYIDEIIENKEKAQKSKGDIVTSELFRVEHMRQTSSTASCINNDSSASNTESSKQISDTSSVSTNSSSGTSIIGTTKVNNNVVPLISPNEKNKNSQQFSIQYISDTPGNLITSGNVISSICKTLSDLENQHKSGSDEQLFKSIDERIMTEKNNEHYKRVIHEMTETEKIHIKGLEILKEVYLFPITKSTNSESVTFVKGIISQIEIIIGVHKKFLKMMEEGEKTSNEGELPMLGANFVKNIQFLKMAATYISKYSSYLEGLTEIMNKEKDVVKAQNKAKQEYSKSHNNCKIELMSFYLITPIQRIPRYELLIRDMLKDVGRDFPDLEQLKKAYLDAKESGRGVNQTRMQLEENEKMSLIHQVISDFPELPNSSARKFICCGPVFAIQNMNDFPSNIVYLFLFNDIIVETKVVRFNGVKIKEEQGVFDPVLFKELTELKNFEELHNIKFILSKVYYFQTQSKVMPQGDSSMVKHVMMLLAFESPQKENEKTPFALIKYAAPTDEQKEVWKSVINDQIEAIKGREEKKKKAQIQLNENISESVSTPEKNYSHVYNRLTIKYKAKEVGSLVTCSGPIVAVAKRLQDNFDHPEINIEAFFKKIEEREMTPEDERCYLNIIQELENGERDHLMNLRTLKEVYLNPIIKLVNKEHATTINELIQQIDVMMNIHQNFLDTFVKSKETQQGIPGIGSEFVKNIQFLKMEATFVNNFNTYQNVLDEVCKDSSIIKAQNKAKEPFMQQTLETEIHPFMFYLNRPLVQTPKYESLIKTMLTHVGKGFFELELLKKAYLDSIKCSDSVNIMKTRIEESEKYLMIRKTIIGQFSNDTIIARKFLCCGPLFIVEKVTEIPQKWMYCFLFNDRLVETMPISIDNKPIKDFVDAFAKLRNMKKVEELSNWQFEIIKECIFNTETYVEYCSHENVCKNLVNLKISQIPYRFSCSTLLESDTWNSIIFDQVERLKNIAQTKRNRRNAGLDFEIGLHKKTLSSSVISISRTRSTDTCDDFKSNTNNLENKVPSRDSPSSTPRRARRGNEDDRMKELQRLQQEQLTEKHGDKKKKEKEKDKKKK
ncbi:rho guanine nucleotide exchange factor putative [Entamoeba histolytica]|uniref:Rho guanine nucleotide exchange factor, putative n=6 Tax=Entamoeba histolytica TaxID=5759 RepID=C4LSM3_ENTH1|nr:Rho guanine nucleotide exchange factor, putative [Entamoeba histolytica HM-1:IMSS]EAL52010.2 Rho guanine nucleotide exchange factor, putative [Entamoeba histolytica HM-1:IMSS]EMD46623.1 rho guanine nucleotide exchange factor, putative [Entamoeba histolytica KU27]ENY59901.1 Rho guanine nucleotide exchange factor, putative [Entamoeba histolytica HM-1:IMSS-A]GAT91432.1 rho guanine nucleotide exchange factor putative [Entamoeba histolytica]|eukprot:XP_657396.2 Rho guanine nucleotide exchange factor, putative [Entamoeba histolytica HM-1:IMSS]